MTDQCRCLRGHSGLSLKILIAAAGLALICAVPVKRPLKQRVSDPFKANPALGQIADITAIKVYDHYKWQKSLKRAQKYQKAHPPSPVAEIIGQQITQDSAQFSLKTISGKNGWMIISFPFPDAVRIQAQWGQTLTFDFFPSSSKSSSDPIVLASSQMSVKVQEAPFHLEFYGLSGKKLLAEPEDFRLELGEGLCRENFVLGKDEKIFGLGGQYGESNHRGKILLMDQDDAYESKTGNTYLPIPFFLSSRGYGLLLNTYQAAVFDLGKTDPDRLSLENPDGNLDYILFFSPDPKKILEEYTEFTGRTPLIPRWSLEPWISRQTIAGWRYDYSAAEDVEKMLSEGFPVGVVLYENLLSGGAEGPDLGIDPKSKPKMPEIIDYWHQRGIKVVGWMSLGQITPRPAHLKFYGLDQHPEYLVRNPDGTLYLGGLGKDMAYLDTTNPEAMSYAWEKIYRPLFIPEIYGRAGFEKNDLDGIKLDFCEFFPPDEVPLLIHHRTPGLRLYHPTYFSEWIYEKINELRPEGGITWVRGAGLGAQKIGFVWTGDRGRTFSQLRHTHIARMNASASGIALMGTDLGGYTGGGILSEEVYNRAAAIDCFSPGFHDHGRSMPPWEQSEQGKDIYRFYARLRYNLIPYLYHLVSQAHSLGLPIMRPMFLECPRDEKCWEIPEQYFLGDDLLVAPVLENTRIRKVYLPEGKWMDFWTRKIEQGPKWIKYPVPLNVIPVFARAGSAIPMQFNNEFELGGAFDQEEKDNLIPGFIVFAEDEIDLDQSFQVFDPSRNPHPETRIKLFRKAAEITIDSLSPLPAGILIYGKKPEKVSFAGKILKEVECKDLLASKGWCYREKDQLTVIYLGI